MTAPAAVVLRRWLMTIWLVTVVVLPLWLWLNWQSLKPAETSLLSLLPETELSALEKSLLAKISAASGNTLLLMLEPAGAAISDEDILRLRTTLEGSGLFASIGTDPAMAARTGVALFPWRYHLLEPGLRARLLSGDEQAGALIVDARLRQLYSPTGMANAGTLEDDPFGFFQGWLLSWLPAGVRMREGAIEVAGGAIVLTAVLKGSGLDLATQFSLAEQLSTLQTEATIRGQHLRLGGVPAFAAHNAIAARSEVSTIGFGSTAGIIILVLLAFRSLKPLGLALLVIGCGIGTGAAVCLLVFGHIHLLTWVFGAALLGIAIDYAMHVMATAIGDPHWRPDQGIARVLRPTALGLLSSLLGFATLLLTPFPVLAEIGTFALSGLAMAWLTCMTLAGPLLKGWRPALTSTAMNLADRIARGRNHLFSRWGVAALIASACLPGLWLLSPDDRITALQASDSPIALDDAIIRDHLPARFASQFFVIEAVDTDALLRRERTLFERLATIVPGIRPYGLSKLLAPADEQQQAINALSTRLTDTGEAERLYRAIGYQSDLAAAEHHRQADAVHQTLDPATLSAALPPPWSMLWAGCSDGTCRSIVLLDTIEDKTALNAIDIEGVRFLDQVNLLSERFGLIRIEAVRMLGVAIVLVTLLLAAIWGVRPALRISAVPCLGLAVAFAWLGYSGALYSVFNVFALLLVFGLGIDYAVFQYTNTGQSTIETSRTELAILLSALTTLLAFGLLATSDTTVIAAFGSTLSAGIIACWLLSPLARPSPPTTDS